MKVWEAIKYGWSWVAWVWGGYEGLVHDYPRAAAIVLAIYLTLTLVF
jgi:hypothetical protein